MICTNPLLDVVQVVRVNLEYKEPLIYSKIAGVSGSLYPGFNRNGLVQIILGGLSR